MTTIYLASNKNTENKEAVKILKDRIKEKEKIPLKI